MKAPVIVRRREAVGVWKRLMSVLLVVLLCYPIFAVRAEEITADGRVNRALLVGCDRFLTQTDTTPSSRNNVLRMADALSGGTLNMQTIVTREDGCLPPPRLSPSSAKHSPMRTRTTSATSTSAPTGCGTPP